MAFLLGFDHAPRVCVDVPTRRSPRSADPAKSEYRVTGRLLIFRPQGEQVVEEFVEPGSSTRKVEVADHVDGDCPDGAGNMGK